MIPVQHPDNARDWSKIKRNLEETLHSVANQDGGGWKAVIVANRGSDLPGMPEGCQVVWVDYEPNPLFINGIRAQVRREELYETFRFDKGRRILAGLLATAPHGHIMIVDNDDAVSRRLARFVSSQPTANGWVILNGYFWNSESSLLYRVSDFCWHCGSCYVVRSDLYRLPASMEEADPAYLRRWLGSHTSLFKELEEGGSKLAPLPFDGAVYRIGHAESFIGSSSILRRYFLKKGVGFGGRMRSLRCLRFRTRKIKQEFFGLR